VEQQRQRQRLISNNFHRYPCLSLRLRSGQAVFIRG
jgi:hypothetical protein